MTARRAPLRTELVLLAHASPLFIAVVAGLHGDHCHVRLRLAERLETASWSKAQQKRHLLVVVTPDLFSDKECLEEIYMAYVGGLSIHRLGFDCGKSPQIVPLDDQWMMTVTAAFQEKHMFNSVARWFHNQWTEPPPLDTVYKKDVVLDSIMDKIERDAAQNKATGTSKVRLKLHEWGPCLAHGPCRHVPA